ncbi:MAG: hypothetical protein DYG88_06930 [Chloroflexi bacterium CFX4]|nr:hypothetical protein [Chloroflexi bacterium CFX4]MDL1922055.1 hypothetical protein [Chloroflexi bacterium CFX3]
MRRRRRSAPTVTEPVEASAESALPRRLTPPRPRLPFTLQGSVLLGILAVIGLGVVWLLASFDILPTALVVAVPSAAAAFGALWFLAALVRRNPRGIVFSAAWLGGALSLLLAAQGIAAVGTTLIGLVFIAVGAALILRGLLMANQPL